MISARPTSRKATTEGCLQVDIRKLARDGLLQHKLIGPTFKDFLFDQHTKRIVLTPFDSDAEFRAVVFTNEATNEAFLVTAGLPRSPGEDYTLQVQHADGSVEKPPLGSKSEPGRPAFLSSASSCGRPV